MRTPDGRLHHEARLHAERRRQMRGLLLLALAALLFILLRFGPEHIFTPGWWRL